MGRHSSNEDDEDDAVATAVDASAPTSAAPARPRPGRHSNAVEDDAAHTAPAGRPKPQPQSDPKPLTRRLFRARGNQATSDDLALLREHSDVRARCIAAVVVPFVLYSVVLYLITALHVYLIWVWIPLVTAGVLAGSILDLEHRRRGTDPDG